MSRPTTIASVSQQIADGRALPSDCVEQCVEQCLAQIDTLEEQLHAWVLVDAAGARQVAQRLDWEAAQNQLRGPLHGIPVGIKDIVDVAGMPTLAGSTLRAGHAAKRDAPLVARLRAAGAIILGKTVTTEFACFDPAVTRNPWNTQHTPGGSSSGSAAAVAAGMCLGAVGTQTGGSITRPASYCGIAGCKPTFGTVDVTGVVPISKHLDHPGPMARCVADLRIMLEVLADVALPRIPFEDDSSRPRIGLVESYFLEQADAEVAHAVRAAADTFGAAGATIEPVDLPEGFPALHAMHKTIMAVDAAKNHKPWFPSRRSEYGPNMATLLDEGLSISKEQYRNALSHQQQFKQDLADVLRPFDALLTPATLTPAPASLATTGDPSFNSPWSHAGVPTVSFPCALSTGGLPIALQLVGAAGRDAHVLSVGEWCEERIGFDQLPPLVKERMKDEG
jgi:aspartyl-tRNA(Asn)/glutamyl-tRNA(Gln) amidotransferase subunit A